MSRYTASVRWTRGTAKFTDNRYSRGHRIDDYVDDAEGFLETDAAGLMWMTRVVLHPQVVWSGDTRPSMDDISAMHNEAHHLCYIANSVKATIDCVPR